MMKRLISLFLVLAMLVGYLPMTARAEETETPEVTESAEVTEEITPEEPTVEDPIVEEPTVEAPAEEEPSAPTEDATEPSESATEPSEEATVPTEAETEPVEEPAEPTIPEMLDEPLRDWDEWEDYYSVVQSGYCGAGENGIPGENLSWVLYSDGSLVITGSGAMMDYAEGRISDSPNGGGPWTLHSTAPWDKHVLAGDGEINWSPKRVFLPEGITHIGDYAFYGFMDYRSFEVAYNPYGQAYSLTLPKSVRSIGAHAFKSCGIPAIKLHEGLEFMGESAFEYNDFVKVEIPRSITKLSRNVFDDCENLKTVVLPKTLTEIGRGAFGSCESLTTINLPESLTVIGHGAFRYCTRLQSVTLPKSALTIENYAFSESGITRMVFPATVLNVGGYVFENCEALEEVVVEGAETYFSSVGSFSKSSLKNVVFAKNVEKIPDGFFADCNAMVEYRVPENIKTIGTGAFARCKNLVKVTIPDSVETIGSGVFLACTALEEVTIPENVKMNADSAFSYCTSLKRVELPLYISNYLRYTFRECTALESVYIPPTVTEIDDYCFYGCRSLKEIELPETVKQIGEYAFSECDSLRQFIDPGIIYYDDGAFKSCDNLEYFEFAGTYPIIKEEFFQDCVNLRRVKIPGDISHVGSWAFSGCKNLEKVYLTISEEKWNYVRISNYNEPLKNAKKHFDGELDSGFCGAGAADSILWSIFETNELIIMGSGEMDNYASPEDAPWYAYRGAITKVRVEDGITSIGQYAFSNLTAMTELYLPGTLQQVGSYAFSGCNSLQKIHYDGSIPMWNDIAIDSGNEALKNAVFTAIPLEDYTDNSAIEINGGGTAYAFYETYPNTTVTLRVNGGSEITETSDSDGIVKVNLGSNFSTKGITSVNVEFLKVGKTALKSPLVKVATVKVTSPLYTETWTGSFDAEVSVGLTEGVEAGIGNTKMKATAGSVEVGANSGSVVTISRELTDRGINFEITADKPFGISGKIETGINGTVLGQKIDLASASAGVKFAHTGKYGIKINNYDVNNLNQQLALATFIMGESAGLASNNTMTQEIVRAITEFAYKDVEGVEYIDGSSAAFIRKADAGLFSIKVEDMTLFDGKTKADMDAFNSLAGGELEVSGSFGTQKSTTGARIKTSSYASNFNLSFLSVLNQQGASIDNIQNKTIEFTATNPGANSAGGNTFEIKSLTDFDTYRQGLSIKKDSVFEKYTFRGTVLEWLVNKVPSLNNFIYSDTGSVLPRHLEEIKEKITQKETSETTIQVDYTEVKQEEKSFKLAMPFSVAVGKKLGLGLSLEGVHGVSYTTKNGYLMNGIQRITADSREAESKVNGSLVSLEDYWDTGIGIIADMLDGFIQTVDGWVQEGVEFFEFLIEEVDDAVHNFKISLFVVDTGNEVRTSYAVQALQRTPMMATGAGITEIQREEMDSVKTIGRGVYVEVTDPDTGEVVEDFEVQPLTLTIRYTQQDLEAAGLSRQSDVVLEGGIAIYRYNDDGDFYEYIGGENDLEDMRVTARITRCGQYLLAADGCAPVLTSLETSDYSSNPTITAFVDDLSGLDMNRFVFMLDGETMVDADNIADHYNVSLGRFTYTVSEDQSLAEGEHTMSFTLADTTGNCETYEYSFIVDMIAPAIEEFTVSGSGNTGSVSQIRAVVSDENLTTVQAVFTKRLEDGTWSDKAVVDMVQLEDGTWALDYEGDGSTVKVYVQATDIAYNSIKTDAIQIQLYAEKVEISEEYIALRQGQTQMLHAEVSPAEFASAVIWSVDNNKIISVDETGTVTAKGVGTAYVTATVTDGENTLTDRCRIDVAEAMMLNGIRLSTAKVTSELNSTDYTTFEVLLKLPQNNTVMSVGENAQIPGDLGIAIESARFMDDTVAKYFSLIPQDDRTLAIVPTDYAISNPKEVKSSYKSTIGVTVEGKEYPSEILTLSVKKSQPKLKVSVPAFNSFYAGQSQDIVITGGTVTSVEATAMPDWLTLEGQTLTLKENAPAKNVSSKVSLLVYTEEWRIPATVTLTVKNTYKAATLKLSASSVTLNTSNKDQVSVMLTAKPADFDISDPTFRLTDSTGKADKTGELTVSYENGKITLGATEKTKGNYKLFVSVGATREVALTVKTISKTPTVSFKVSGNPDISIPGSVATVTPTFKNYSGDFTLVEEENQQFNLIQDGKTIRVSAKDGTKAGRYTLTLKLKLADGTVISSTAKVTVKQTALKLKLSASKLTLNKTISDMGEISVTSATKGYELTKPVRQLMDKSGKNAAEGKLDISWNNGKLTVATNKFTEYGATYKLLVKAGEGHPAQTLTITVLAQNKSNVTSSLKAKGSIDVIRDGSAVTLTPSYKNSNAQTKKTARLAFYKVVGKTLTPADALFSYTANADGSFTVTKAEGADLDHSGKYQVELITVFGETYEVKSKPIAISVKQGSAKVTLTAGDTVLFSEDIHDRITFRIDATDAALNGIAKVEIKDAKYKNLLEIIDYGNGEFAIGFPNGKVDKSLIGKTVTVNFNVFIEGNQTAKANTTAKLKLTVLK